MKLTHSESFITHMLLVCENVSFCFLIFNFGTNWRELIDTGDCEIFTREKPGACPKIQWCVSCQAPSSETKSFHGSTKQGEHLVLFVWTLLGYLEGMLHFKIALEFGCPMKICDPKVRTSIRFLKWALNIIYFWPLDHIEKCITWLQIPNHEVGLSKIWNQSWDVNSMI